jgi:hypothetical protein
MQNDQSKFVVVDERVKRDLGFLDLESFDGRLYVDCSVGKIGIDFLGC